jgi:hypothetical protein
LITSYSTSQFEITFTKFVRSYTISPKFILK